MKKLIESRYFWLLTALLGAVLLPLLTLTHFKILLALPAEYQMEEKLLYDTDFDRCTSARGAMIIQFLPGLILGGCAGFACYLLSKQEKYSVRLAKRISLLGGGFVGICFGYLCTLLRDSPKDLWVFVPIFGYPFVFALVLFLWGLHLPNRKPEPQTETESSS